MTAFYHCCRKGLPIQLKRIFYLETVLETFEELIPTNIFTITEIDLAMIIWEIETVTFR